MSEYKSLINYIAVDENIFKTMGVMCDGLVHTLVLEKKKQKQMRVS